MNSILAMLKALRIAGSVLVVGCASTPPIIEPEFVSTEIGPALKSVRGGRVLVAKVGLRKDPVYPESVRRQRIQGPVHLEVLIDTAGNVVRIVPVSGPHEELIRSAVEAVRQWKFEPPSINGRSVAMLTDVFVDFSLY